MFKDRSQKLVPISFMPVVSKIIEKSIDYYLED